MLADHLSNSLAPRFASPQLTLLIPMNQLTDYVVSSLVFVAI